ncbi:MAG: diaminopimelate decarboxylase family protein, partial [Luteibaculum sp.]
MDSLAQQLSKYPTPFYLYDLSLLEETLNSCKREADKYGYKVHYALKANVNPEILSRVKQYGFGADCVSGNEVKCAYKEGFSPAEIVFAGVGKTDREIETALNIGIARFNVESLQELEVIQEIAARLEVKASVNIRINPNVQSFTHANITTGLSENKFGLSPDAIKTVIQLAKSLPNVHLGGLHFHIGSQI